MNIMHVVGGSAFGGASRIISSIVESQADIYNVSVLTTEPRLSDMVRASGCQVIDDIDIVREIAPVRDLVAVIRLASRLHEERVDLIHTHTSKGGVIGRLAGTLAGVPVRVHTVHNFAIAPSSGAVRRSLNFSIEKCLALMTTRVVFVSEWLGALAMNEHICDEEKLAVVPNGLTDLESRPVFEGMPPIVMYHGRLARGKGIEELIRAAARVRDRGSSIDLRIYGEGPLRSDLANLLAAEGWSSQVLRGFTSDVHAALSDAVVCVQPSHREGLSIALLECMRAQRCILASDIEANREVLDGGACGALFAAGDVDELSDSLERLLASPADRLRYADAAKARFLAKYSAEAMRVAYRKLYAEVFAGSVVSRKFRLRWRGPAS